MFWDIKKWCLVLGKRQKASSLWLSKQLCEVGRKKKEEVAVSNNLKRYIQNETSSWRRNSCWVLRQHYLALLKSYCLSVSSSVLELVRVTQVIFVLRLLILVLERHLFTKSLSYTVSSCHLWVSSGMNHEKRWSLVEPGAVAGTLTSTHSRRAGILETHRILRKYFWKHLESELENRLYAGVEGWPLHTRGPQLSGDICGSLIMACSTKTRRSQIAGSHPDIN